MTAYTTIPATDYDAESPIDVDLMTGIVLNPTAITEGSAGAPKIQTAALEQTAASEAVTQATIRDAAVGQAQLKTTTASQSVTMTTANNKIAPTGATYTLSYFLGADADKDYAVGMPVGLTGYNASVGIINAITPSSGTAYLYSRYVQASPPYNLGNGDVALFIMAKINKTTKEVLATEVATDPFWAYHGPHDLHPHHGKLQKAAGLWGVNINPVLVGADISMTRDDLLLKLSDMKTICTDPDLLCNALSYDFTMEEKNIDMNIAPHSMGECGQDEAIVFIDPVGTITDQLSVLHEAMGSTTFEGGSITELLESKYIEIGDPLDAVTPSGVLAVSASWKNTV